jgi:hypothetical protein
MKSLTTLQLSAALFAMLIFLLATGAGGSAAPTVQSVPGSRTVEQAATDLCGRSLGGRCSKGRAACSRGTPEQCAAWRKWSAGCNTCAQAFVKCRARVGQSYKYTCDICIAAHDACEAKIRVVH